MSTTTRAPRVTIKTVAEHAGVSVSAVSKVLRDAYGVSDDLRQKVNASIVSLNYRPSMAARSMRGRTQTVGVLLVGMDNPFLPTVVKGISDTLAKANYKTMLAVGQAEVSIETSLIDSMLDFQMDGIILVAPRLKGALLAKYAHQIPTVVLGHHEPEAEAFDTINADDFTAMQDIVDRLHRDGRRRIEMVSIDRSPNTSDVMHQREMGYTQRMNSLGLGEHIRIHRLAEREGKEGSIVALASRAELPDAFVCWSDIHAIGLISEGRARGWRIPRDIAITGFDDGPTAALPQIGLTSYNHDGHSQGSEAAHLLLSRIQGRTKGIHKLVGGYLVERSSTLTSNIEKA